jgi:hypothetical protein
MRAAASSASVIAGSIGGLPRSGQNAIRSPLTSAFVAVAR